MNKIALIRTLMPRIKQMVSPEQALREYVPGISISRSRYACCPFHGEKTASLKILPNRVYCYGCHFSGDVVEIISRLFGLSAYEAIQKLNEDFGLGLPIDRPLTLREGLALKDQAREAQAEAQRREAEREAQRQRASARADIEDRLYILEGLVDEIRPTDPDKPFDPFWCWTVNQITTLRYRIEYDDYEV